MHTSRPLLAALSGAFVSLVLASSAFAQGALTPPGAPAPSMKTLDQIEPRTPLGTPGVVTTSTIVISQPGSYVLVGPVTVASGDGITINADNVTLDLNGFTVSSTANPRAGSGVASANTGIVVRNGVVDGAGAETTYNLDPATIGFANGVALGTLSGNFFSPTKGTRVENLRGGAFPGFGLGASQVQASSVRYAALAGIRGNLVSDCSVSLYSGYGIQGDNIRGCTIGYGYTTAPNAAISGNVIDTCTAGISGGIGFVGQIIKHSYISVASKSGTPFTAAIAIGCTFNYDTFGVGTGSPSNVITNRYEMP